MRAFIFTTSTFGDCEINHGFYIIIDKNKNAAKEQFFKEYPDILPLGSKRKYYENVINIEELSFDSKKIIELIRASDM